MQTFQVKRMFKPKNELINLDSKSMFMQFIQRQVTALRPPTTFRMGSLLQELKSLGLFYQN